MSVVSIYLINGLSVTDNLALMPGLASGAGLAVVKDMTSGENTQSIPKARDSSGRITVGGLSEKLAAGGPYQQMPAMNAGWIAA